MSQLKIFLEGFKSGFKEFGFWITNIINFILLALVYFISIGIVSIIAKVSSKHFLDLKRPQDFNSSYWRDLDLGGEPRENYYRQF